MNERAEQTTGRKSRDDRVTTLGFFVALWLPLAMALLQPAGSLSELENRALTPFPSVRELPAASLPGALEAWYDDHLGFRRGLIRGYSWINVALLGVSPSQKLLVGRDGWFYFDHADAVAQMRGLAVFDDAELERWKTVLEERRDWLAARGIPFLLVLVPNKHAIYPEYIEHRRPRVGDLEQHAQLARYLREHSDIDVLDLMPTLLEAKRERRVYHRTDTHWNDLGAYLAYEGIVAWLAKVLPDAELAPPVAVDYRERSGPGMGLTSIAGLSGVYGEEMLELVKRAPRARVEEEHRATFADRYQRQLPLAYGTGDHRLPRAVVFRDSFANALIPYLSESFERVLYVWERDVDPRIVEIERPDVVLQQIAGRFLDRPPIGIAELEAQRGSRRGGTQSSE